MSLHPMGIKLVPYSFLFREERDTFSSRSSSAYDNGTSHRMQLGGNGLVKKEGIFSFVSSFIVQVCRSFIYLTTDCERKLKIGKTKSRYQLATLVNCCLSILFSAITFDGIERNKKKTNGNSTAPPYYRAGLLFSLLSTSICQGRSSSTLLCVP